ncbi:MAG: sel1 repeat family protein [Rhodobacteraceae bacterium]|nr:sel1 repeat family protein [Paracoccaceae bacterium]
MATKTRDLPIVFMSFDEPWADEYWEDLHQKAPWAKRVHGVAGLDSCHKAALKTGGGDFVITVDADTLVRPSFFDVEIPDELLRPFCRIEWPSKNLINGQIYGNGSLKCWPAEMINEMRTHENSPSGTVSVDHAVGANMQKSDVNPRVSLPAVHADVNPALTPYHAFRCGFREGVRLSLGGSGGIHNRTHISRLPERQLRRLACCSSLGADCQHGTWLIYGTRLGLWMTHASEWDFTLINAYHWFDSFWNDIIRHRFGPGGSACPYTDFTWDEARLQAEIIALGQNIQTQFGLEVFDLSPSESTLFKEMEPETLDWWMSDSFGYMYQKGFGVDLDPTRARELFEIGALNGLASSVNNLARMQHLGEGQVPDAQGAIAIYQQAIDMGEIYAPYHLARLLRRLSGDDVTQKRADALQLLSAERGFDPDGLLYKKAESA